MAKLKHYITFGNKVSFEATFVGFSEPLFKNGLEAKGIYDVDKEPFANNAVLSKEITVEFRRDNNQKLKEDMVLNRIEEFCSFEENWKSFVEIDTYLGEDIKYEFKFNALEFIHLNVKTGYKYFKGITKKPTKNETIIKMKAALTYSFHHKEKELV